MIVVYLVALAGTFVFGYLAGAATGHVAIALLRRQDTLPMPRIRVNRRDVVLAVATLMAAGALIAAAVGKARDDQQDRANIERNHRVIDCVARTIDQFLTAVGPVREAAVRRDEAESRRDVALNQTAQAFGDLLLGVATGTVDDPAAFTPLRTALTQLTVTSKQLTKARHRYEAVRKANPYPAPTFDQCEALIEDQAAHIDSLPAVTLPAIPRESDTPAPRRSEPNATVKPTPPAPTPAPAASPTVRPKPPKPQPTTPPDGLLTLIVGDVLDLIKPEGIGQ